MSELTYAVHTTTCMYLLDEEGVCRWVFSAGGRAASDADRAVGAQFVACLDVSVDGGLVGELRVGAAVLLCREDDGRFVLLRTPPIARVEYRGEGEDSPSFHAVAIPRAPPPPPSSQGSQFDEVLRTVRLPPEDPLIAQLDRLPHFSTLTLDGMPGPVLDPALPAPRTPPPRAPPPRAAPRTPPPPPMQAKTQPLPEPPAMVTMRLPGVEGWDGPPSETQPFSDFEMPAHMQDDGDMLDLDSEDLLSISVTEVTLNAPLYRSSAGLPPFALPAPVPPPRRGPGVRPPIYEEAPPPAQAAPQKPPSVPVGHDGGRPPGPAGPAGYDGGSAPKPPGPAGPRKSVVGPGRRLR